MGYQDPLEEFRTARHAWKAQKRANRYAWKAQMRADRAAYRAQRHFNRYHYRRSSGGIVGTVIIILIALFVITHIWPLLVMALGVLIVVALVYLLLKSSIFNSWLPGFQSQQRTSQQQQQQGEAEPYQAPQEARRPYEQGYQPYQEGGRLYQYPPPSQPVSQPGTPRYDEPQAQYPEQMPPML
jgi:hypothetical protein